jgi:hypothetical protein
MAKKTEGRCITRFYFYFRAYWLPEDMEPGIVPVSVVDYTHENALKEALNALELYGITSYPGSEPCVEVEELERRNYIAMQYKFTFRTDNFVPGKIVKFIPDKIAVCAETKGEAFSKAKEILYNPNIALLETIFLELGSQEDFEDDLHDVSLTLEHVELLE